MEDERKTKKQMIEELNELRQSVSELKGFEEEVKQTRITQEMYTKAFQHNAIPMTITSAKEGKVVEVSDAFLSLVGLKRHEIVGHSMIEGGFITKEQRTAFLNELKKSGRVDNFELEIRPKSKGWRYGLFNIVMISFNNENCLLTTIQDITERKQAEEARHESEQNYRLLATYHKNLNDISISLTEASGTEDLFNRIAESLRFLTGAIAVTFSVYNQETSEFKVVALSSDPISRDKVDSIFGPELFEMSISLSAADMANMLSQSIKRTKNLRELLFGVMSQEISDALMDAVGCRQIVALAISYAEELVGTCIAYLSEDQPVVMDEALKTYIYLSGLAIKRMRTKDSLQESRKQLYHITDNIPAFVNYVNAQDLCYKFVNKPFADAFGKLPEELIGRQVKDTLAEADYLRALAYVDRARAGERIRYENILHIHGEPRWFIIDYIPDLDEMGTTKNIIVLALDITERKQVEEKFRLITENMVDCVALVDQNGTFQYVTPSTGETLGYDREEMIGITGYSITHPDDLEEITRLFPKDIVHNRRETNYETRLRHKNGHYVSLEVRARTLADPQGKRMGSVFAARDITDRKQQEAEKIKLEYQNRQLQKSESLGRMAGAIAHHFNNQLGVVIGNLEMAIDDQPKGVTPSENLTTAMKAAWKSADMSGLMLTYLGQSHDEREPLDLSYCCRKILPLIKTTLPGNVVIETDFPLSRQIIMANSGEIQQILTNLITNAREAIGQNKGTISLSVKEVPPAEISTAHLCPIGWQPQNKVFACMEVTDTGCGIEGNAIEQLFDPFFTDKFTGRGMGLPVVLGIVKTYKGAITVDSKPGRGSIFRVFFPVSDEAHGRPQKAVSKKESLISALSPTRMKGSETVLVAEDDEMLRDMAVAMLEILGYSALKARDGVEALEIFGKHQSEIQFVLSDLTMPRMNGWEALTELRKIQPGIPVILASGYDLARVMEGDHPELPQAFLAKPYNLDALNNAISQALESPQVK